MKIIQHILFLFLLFLTSTALINAQEAEQQNDSKETSTTFTNAQESEQQDDWKEMKRNIVSFNVLGTTPIWGITFERIIAKKTIIEAGVGLGGIGAGVKFYSHPIQTNKLLVYTGLNVNYFDLGVNTRLNHTLFAYAPVGLSYFLENKLCFGLDIGPAIGKDTSSFFKKEDSIYSLYGNLKIGYRF